MEKKNGMLEFDNECNTSIKETMIHNINLMSPTFTSSLSFTTPTPNLNLDGRMRFTSENEDDFCRAM